MKNLKETFSFGRIYNIVLLLVLLVLWINVVFVHGMAGAVSWALLKFVFAPIGVVLFLVSLVFLMISLIRKRNISQQLISVVLSMALALPILMLMNIMPLAYPIQLESVSPSVTIQSPFAEPVLVGWGGDTVEDNAPHVIWASERWAYDLLKEPADTGSHQLEDHGIYDEELYAPIAGVVVAVYDQEKDITPNTEDFISLEGNYVYIKINETQTYLLLNHLKKNSVAVEVGDEVEVGDYLGKVGNSGTTSEPHLHIHHQRQNPTETVHPILAEGLPLYFYDVNGDAIMPTAGNMIEGFGD